MMKSNKQKYNEIMKLKDNAHVIENGELKKLQALLLEMYLDVQNVCDKHNLTCMLIGGSALGAKRHNGFIPWDDDLDFAMPRANYEVLKENFKEWLGDKYILNAPNYDGNPTNRFPKVLRRGTKFVEYGSEDDERACIKIDVFILENIPDNLLLRYLKGLHCTWIMFAGGVTLSYEEWMRTNNKKTMSRKAAIGKMLSYRSSEEWFDRFDRAVRCKNEKSRDVGIPSGRKHYFGEILQRVDFLPTSTGMFEGSDIYLPADTEKYLTNLYGSYMEIPPEEKREKHYIERIEFE